ncbi:MAG: DegV family protein [Clostridia bacterium]|nr:DegV family protein [Clostridia bacterium]
MQYQIVADSSSNLFHLEDVSYAHVPMKLITSEKEYVDEPGLNLEELVCALEKLTTPTGSSCPNSQEWLDAFGDADGVFGVTITSNLSGCHSAASVAADDYRAQKPDAKVCILDSLSTGPEMKLIVEKLRERILSGDIFEQIEQTVRNYMKHTHLLFTLQSLNNLARNGRVSPAVAKIATVLRICIMGRASDVGTLEPLQKCRGEKRALIALVDKMKELGFKGGKVRIDHCLNLEGARQLKDMILSHFPSADIIIDECRALCSFYAERGGLLVGFEDGM